MSIRVFYAVAWTSEVFYPLSNDGSDPVIIHSSSLTFLILSRLRARDTIVVHEKSAVIGRPIRLDFEQRIFLQSLLSLAV